MEIVRKVEPNFSNGQYANDGNVQWWNEFTLLYKGASYKLKAGTGAAYGRYYCEDENFLYIERRNPYGGDSTATNTTRNTGSFVLAWYDLPLGKRSDSEQVIRTNYYDCELL
jgi:hypothetical protein